MSFKQVDRFRTLWSTTKKRVALNHGHLLIKMWRDRPSSSGQMTAPPSPATRPTFTCGSSTTALSLITNRSHSSAIDAPATRTASSRRSLITEFPPRKRFQPSNRLCRRPRRHLRNRLVQRLQVRQRTGLDDVRTDRLAVVTPADGANWLRLAKSVLLIRPAGLMGDRQ